MTIPISEHNLYTHHNETARDEAWNAINVDTGTVVLSTDFVAKFGLPEAQPFPWDPEKSVYVLSSYHSLHCVVSRVHFLIVTDEFAKHFL